MFVLAFFLLTGSFAAKAQESGTYCPSASTQDMFEHIVNVSFGNVNNPSEREKYGDFTNLSSTFFVGENFDVSATVTGDWSINAFVWVDWNHDFIFSEDEKTVLTKSKVNADFVGTVNVPVTALAGNTRMRVSAKYGTPEQGPCDTFNYGEVEDYTVNVVAEGIFASFSASTNKVGINEEVIFTDASIGGDQIASYQWNFGEGATPATADTKGPHSVTYATLGDKTAKLTITDAQGTTNVKTIENVVTVISGNANYVQPSFFGATADFNTIKMSWYAPGETPVMQNPESFESGYFPPAGWQIKVSDDFDTELSNLSLGSTSWVLSNESKYVKTGSHSAAIYYSVAKTNWLITPSVDIEADKQLSFEMYFRSDYYKSIFKVMVQENGTWSELQSFGPDELINEMTDIVTIDLAEYAGKSVKFAFVQKYSNGHNIAIDDVTIEDKSTKRRVTGAKSRRSLLVPQFQSNDKAGDKIDSRQRFSAIFAESAPVQKGSDTPIGYNIYLDGVKQGATLAADVRNFEKPNNAVGDYVCTMSVVYAGGESYQTEGVLVTTVAPEVDFEVDVTETGINQDVKLTSLVKGSYGTIEWNFGEGAVPATSTEANPTVKYTTLGEKTITVTLNGDSELSATHTVVVRPGVADVAPLKGFNATANYNNVKVSWSSLSAEAKYLEGFEGEAWPPAGWESKYSATLDGELVDPSAEEDQQWFLCDKNTFSDPQYVQFGEYSSAISYGSKEFNWLITPEQQIVDGDKLSFWLWYFNDDSYFSNFRVMVKADGQWNEELFYTEGSPTNTYQSEVVVDLSGYANKTVRIAFVYEYSDGYEVAIDEVSIIGATTKNQIDDFGKINIYRDDVVVKEVTDPQTTEWTDENLETGEYRYYATFVNNNGAESFPSKTVNIVSYKSLNLPYSQNFESTYADWLFSDEQFEFKAGVTADFDNEFFQFPAHDGTYVAVNTSEVPGGFFGYTEASAIVALPPLNLGEFGRANFSFDYFADILGFAVVGRKSPADAWVFIKQLMPNKAWESSSFQIPDEYLTDGYQFGFMYSNLKEESNGVAFDNITINGIEGKHLVVEVGSQEVENNATQYLGMVKPNSSKEYTLSIRNIGNQPIDLGDINFEGDKFVVKNNPSNTSLAVKETAEIVITYNTTVETETADLGKITINSNAEENPFTLNIKAECGTSDWTYMLYLYEDGTGLNGNRDINEWEVNGSIEGKVNYIVLYDCNDDEKDGIYYITKDGNGMNTEIVSKRISEHLNANLDMNKWETLRDFILWGKENFQAKHYGCNVWDHGDGIFRNKQTPVVKAACGDMKLWDLRKALKAFKDVDGQGMDIFGFDVCLLGQVETSYEIKDYTNVVIASEKTEPGDGWDYNSSFAMLNDNSQVDIYDFAANIVEMYDASFDNGSQGTANTTQAAIRTDKFKSDFIPALNNFADLLSQSLYENKAAVKECVDAAWYSDGEDYIEHKDLGHFVQLLKENAGISDQIKEEADKFLTAYNSCVVKSLENNRPNATGMKIWLPENIMANNMAGAYLLPNLYLTISETRWDDFLKMYENPVAPAKPSPNFYYIGELTFFPGGVVQFFDGTVCNPVATARQWKITPETYEFVDGTDASSENVYVKFNEPGNYTISLTVTNELGEGTSTAENMVVVKKPNFLAPMNLTADFNKEDRTVSLAWEKGVDMLPEGVKLNEDFEGNVWPSEGWSVKYSATIDGEQTDPTADGGKKWTKIDENSYTDAEGNPQPKYIHGGKYAVAIAYSAPDFNWLISPELAIENGDKLTFWAWYMNDESEGTYYYTNFRVMVLADGAWNEVLYYTDGAEPNEYQSEISVDLSAYDGKNIKIAFVYEFTDGWQMAIDDIKVVSAEETSRRAACAPMVKSVVNKQNKTRVANSSVTRMINVKTATRQADGELVSYKLYRNGVELSDQTELTFNEQLEDADATYEYYVTAVYSNPDGESQASNVVSVTVEKTTATAIADGIDMGITAYPNPSNGTFTLNVNNVSNAQWYLVDMNGRVVNSGVMNGNNAVINVKVNGVYMVKVVAENSVNIVKVIVK